MALGFYITAKGFTQERYDTTLGQLEAAGAGAPDGRISHVALETDGEIQVWIDWLEKDGLFKAGQIKARDVYTNEFNFYRPGKTAEAR